MNQSQSYDIINKNRVSNVNIAIASDHAGYELKTALVQYLQKSNQIEDLGTFSSESVDYPDYALGVARRVAQHQADLGILICYTGIGMSIAANKINGIRAALVGSVENARLTKEHNDANVLCLSAKDTPPWLAQEIADAFIKTQFCGGRHSRRVAKIGEAEQ